MANSTIKFPQEMPPAATINGNDKIMISDAATNEAKSATWDAAKQYLNITGIELIPIAPGPLPAGPAGEVRKMQITEAGTWTYAGSATSPFVNPDGSVMILWWDGSVWTIADQYDMPMQDLQPIESDIDLDGSQMFTKKGIYINASGKEAENAALECTNFIRVKDLSAITGSGRGQDTAPMITFYDEAKVKVGDVVESSLQSDFNILREDFPSNSYYIRINSFLNMGKIKLTVNNKINAVIDEMAFQNIIVKSLNGYYDTSGLFTVAQDYRATELIPTINYGGIFIENAFSNGSQVPPVVFFKEDGFFLSALTGFPAGATNNIKLDESLIPAEASYFAVNHRPSNTLVIRYNVGEVISDTFQKATLSSISSDPRGLGLFVNKGKFVDASGYISSNSALECTDYIQVDTLTVLSGIGRGGVSSPMITFYDADKKKVGVVNGTSSVSNFSVIKADFPAESKYVIINSLIGKGQIYISVNNQINSLSDRFSAQELNNIPYTSGCITTTGTMAGDATWGNTDKLFIQKNDNVLIYGAATNGEGVQPVVFFDRNKNFLSSIVGYSVNNNMTLKLDSSNIPDSAFFYSVNFRVVNDLKIETNIGSYLSYLSNNIEDTSSFVKKVSGKELSSNDFTDADKEKIDVIIKNGDGSKFLSDSGSYRIANVDAEFGGVIDSSKSLVGISYKVWYFASAGVYNITGGSIQLDGADLFVLSFNGNIWSWDGIALDNSKDYLIVDSIEKVRLIDSYYINLMSEGLLKGVMTNGVAASGDSSNVIRYDWDSLNNDYDDGNFIIKPTSEANGRFVRHGIIEYGNINKSFSNAVVHSGSSYARKPFVAFTFDDGYMNDYTLLKPFMDNHNIKGSIYINSKDSGHGLPKMTAKEIKEMSNEGWEFGSHTATHSGVYNLALSQSIEVGDTTISVINSGTVAQFKPSERGTKYYVRKSGTTDNIVFECNGYTLSGGVLTMTLTSPSSKSISTPANIYLTEEEVYREVVEPKEFLESLNVPCVGFAAPWGIINDIAKGILQNEFEYSRDASASVKKTNGGVFDGDDIKLNQYNLFCSELVDLTSDDMDALIAETISKQALLIILGHTNGWTNLQNKLTTFISKMNAAGIDHGTLSEGMLRHSNAGQIGDFSFLKTGQPNLTILPRGTFTNNLSPSGANVINTLPNGISYMRTTSGDAAGFPGGAGIVKTERYKFSGIANNWMQWFVATNGDAFFRRGLSVNTATDWKSITSRSGASFPTYGLSVGEQFYRTDLSKPFWYDGAAWRDANGTIL